MAISNPQQCCASLQALTPLRCACCAQVLAVDSRAELLEAVAKQCAAQQPVGELIPVVADVSTAEGRTVVLNTVLERRFTIMGLILIHGALSKASHVAALDNSEYSRVRRNQFCASPPGEGPNVLRVLETYR